MNAGRIQWMAVLGLLAMSGMAVAKEHPPERLNIGRGIDHVASLVRQENFTSAGNVLTQKLGFAATPVLTAAGGIENRIIWFPNLSYLELDAFTENNPSTAPFLDFLAHHEGAKFYGTEVLDADEAVSFLTGAGYPNVGPFPAGPLTIQSTGQTVGLTPLWRTIILTSRLAPDNSNFFLDYDEDQVQQMFHDFPVLAPRPHPNTARKIETVWLVVADLNAAIDFYEGLGLEVHPRHERIGYLGARGAVVQYRHSTLTLLVPDGPGIAANFAADRGEGILGVSIEVGHLRTAHNLVQGNTGLALPVFRHRGRDRFLIPASLTHGFLIEMVE
jgi:catechol 2,3-dioxygenase-like lactoylglutathione lyase family enzyme